MRLRGDRHASQCPCNGCNLSGANFRGADVSGANLGGANLGKACLVDADLTGANLRGANLGKAVLCRTRMPDGSLDNSGCAKVSQCCPNCIEVGRPCGAGKSGSCRGKGQCVDTVCAAPPISCDPATRQWMAQTAFGTRGSRPHQCNAPNAVAVAADEQTVWVADTGNSRTSVWALTCPPAP